MDNCIFCKIVKGEIPGRIAYEDGRVMAFHDVSPQAPVHVLIVPKKHYESVLAVPEEENALIGHMFAVASRLAHELGVAEKGFRLVINTGKDGGQTVPHLHLHLTGGREHGWPAG